MRKFNVLKLGSNNGQITIISLAPIRYHKIDGCAVLVDAGAEPALRRIIEQNDGVDAAAKLGVSEKLLHRIKKGLGIPLRPRLARVNKETQ